MLPWVATAFGLYLAAVVITMAIHEPLNEKLKDAGDPDQIADLVAVRDAFHETRWIAWHIMRTITTAAAFGCLAWALVLHGRVTAATADTADTADHGAARQAQTTSLSGMTERER